MGAIFLAIAVMAGAALTWRLAGPAAAVPVAFFGLWGALVLWTLERAPADEPPPVQEREPEIEIRI
jgi:hypothetical protein